MIGVFAPPGATIPRSGMVLKLSAIRGVESHGMLCSGYELGLSDDHRGHHRAAATTRRSARPSPQIAGLDDPVLDIKVTPNRADCLGVRGIARDLAASGLGTLEAARGRRRSRARSAARSRCISPGPTTRPARSSSAASSAACSNGPSPRWLQDRLDGDRAAADLGAGRHHQFPHLRSRPAAARLRCRQVAGDLVVRGARPGETLAALNGKTYTLDAEMTVIADDRQC